MAKKTPTDAPPIEQPAARSFIVNHPKLAAGELLGLKFVDHVCETADAINAHASQEHGCTVTDKATGQPAW